jgi:epsilon-lactone hydrolase
MTETNRSLTELLLYFCYLVVTIPLRRLFQKSRVVKQWSIRTEIGVAFLKRMTDNKLDSARKVEAKIARIANLAVRDPIIEVGDIDFFGLFVGPKSDGPIVFYLHGGGYSLCSSTTYIASYSRMLAILKDQGVAAQVFALEYTLAPEAQFPTQINEALSALYYLSKKNRPIFLMGDSAGGNLVLALLQTLKGNDELLAKVKAGILISPWVNLKTPPISYDNNKDSDFVHVKDLIDHTSRYVPSSESINNPLISPSEMTFFKGLPPLFIHYGGKEVFAADIEKFIESARNMDVTTVKEEFGPHITPMLLPFFPDMAERGLKEITKFIRSHL